MSTPASDQTAPDQNASEQIASEQIDEINASVRYAGYSVFRLTSPFGDSDRAEMASEVEALFARLADDDIVVRGSYDVSGLRADADLLIWWHAPSADLLQRAYKDFRSTAAGRRFDPVWSNLGVHRPAEFNRSHVPAFLAGDEPLDWICVYPFVRSYEWYLLPEAERGQMLREHGQAARDFGDVQANTIAAFALGDYEWLLAFEADELHRIVDLMRALRPVGARRHVREEVPFYTGRRLAFSELVNRWP